MGRLNLKLNRAGWILKYGWPIKTDPLSSFYVFALRCAIDHFYTKLPDRDGLLTSQSGGSVAPQRSSPK